MLLNSLPILSQVDFLVSCGNGFVGHLLSCVIIVQSCVVNELI